MPLAALAGLLAAPALAQDAGPPAATPDAGDTISDTVGDTVSDGTGGDALAESALHTPGQCDAWLGGMLAADADGSGGLSGSEFASFLGGIEEPPYLKEYFGGLLADGKGYGDLPWVFQVAFVGLACRCQDLGMGDGCCASDGAEVPLAGLAPPVNTTNSTDSANSTEPTGVEKGYRADLCAQVAYSLDKAVDTPSPTPPPTASPTNSPTAGPTASPAGTTASPVAAPGKAKAGPSPGAVLRVTGSTADRSSSDGIVYYVNAEDVTEKVQENKVLVDLGAGLASLAADALPSARGGGRALRGGGTRTFGMSDADIAAGGGSRGMQGTSAPGGRVSDIQVRDVGELSFCGI